jgi:type IV pilus assembly protein PilV
MKSLQSSSGFTLVEALVALVVLSVGMLGMASLYVVTLQSGGTAIYRTQAVNLAADMADRIRANRTATTAVNNGYGAAGSSQSCTGTTDCTPANMAADDLYTWGLTVAKQLPGGTGTVTVLGDPTVPPVNYQIQLSWTEPSQTAPIVYTLLTQI